MKKTFVKFVVLLSALAAATFAADVLDTLTTTDGLTYHNVRWGPVNQGKVVVFHNRGVTYLPLEKLPAELQARFGVQPAAVPAPATADPATAAPRVETAPTSQPATVVKAADLREQLESMRLRSHGTAQNSAWTQYVRERAAFVLLEGKLVERAQLVQLTGIVVKFATIDDDTRSRVPGTVLELAEKRPDAKPVPSQMELRPSLWRGTGQQVYLVRYEPENSAGDVIRVYAKETNPVGEVRAYIVGKEPSFEQWQQLRHR